MKKLNLINLVIVFLFISNLMLNANVIEDEILRLINLERSKIAVAPIPNNERLHSIALYHSDNMANNKFLGNTDLDGLDSKDRQIKLYPEMVGTLTESFAKLDVIPLTDKNAASSIVKKLMETPDDKKYLLDADFNAIGIGASKRGIGVYVTITYANIIAEEVDFESEAKYGDDITVKYRILNKAPFTDFKIALETADKEARILGEDGKTYIGGIIYDVENAGNNVLSRTFKAEYGRGDYKVSLLYKGKRYESNIKTITVK